MDGNTKDGHDPVWCFLENVRDPSNFKSGCYSDTTWSAKDGRFWSARACDGLPPIDGGEFTEVNLQKFGSLGRYNIISIYYNSLIYNSVKLMLNTLNIQVDPSDLIRQAINQPFQKPDRLSSINDRFFKTRTTTRRPRPTTTRRTTTTTETIITEPEDYVALSEGI